MEAITIPSPSAFLRSPVIAPAKTPVPPTKRKPASSKQPSAAPKKPTDPTKPKQSKSRNGCITCKAKRLKCDETKPTCQQCQKRSVTCGGYKKDFKWKAFEETTFVNKAAPQRTKRTGIEQSTAKVPNGDQTITSPALSAASSNTSTPEAPATRPLPAPSPGHDVSIPDHFFQTAAPSPSPFGIPSPTFLGSMIASPSLPYDMTTPTFLRDQPPARIFDHNTISNIPLYDENADHTPLPPPTRPPSAGQSPRLIDLLLPGSELNARPSNNEPLQQSIQGRPYDVAHELAHNSLLEDDIEEVIRQPDPPSHVPDSVFWMSPRGVLTIRADSQVASTSISRENTYSPIYRQPEVQAGSPEQLILRFDRQTCGILSVKDGPTENPWRTLVWPLARDSPALYHALASMTAFHTSKERPALRVDGMEHMRRSIRSLATGIENMRVDTALATTLALAFSESWDQHISTGIEHLRGAKILVQRALTRHKKHALAGDDLARLRFLCNTWVYMDVIARLTSVADDELVDFNNILAPVNSPLASNSAEIDPLMGCAISLFPLIGKAATLCRKAQRARSTSISLLSQAMELKEKIERWQPETDFEKPEDPTADILHALQTAEAYRYATLLYLHQAFPEIPSQTSAELAKKVLVCLVTVPLSSRLVIVQIYPLLAAGCEAHEPEDREWVRDRWQSMAQRMWIGNIDRCWEVVQEVWNRRDRAEAAQAAQNSRQSSHSEFKRKFNDTDDEIMGFSDHLNSAVIMQASKRQRGNSSTSLPIPSIHSSNRRRNSEPSVEQLDTEYTVRGRLHWVSVMKDWQWEILLG